MNTLGATAKKLRERKGLTQVALGQRTGLGEPFVKRLEGGNLPQVDYTLSSLRSIAAALGCSLPAFLREAGVVDAADLSADMDPGLSQLIANINLLTVPERESVEQLIALLARKGSSTV